jgi:hypothetical protein
VISAAHQFFVQRRTGATHLAWSLQLNTLVVAACIAVRDAHRISHAPKVCRQHELSNKKLGWGSLQKRTLQWFWLLRSTGHEVQPTRAYLHGGFLLIFSPIDSPDSPFGPDLSPAISIRTIALLEVFHDEVNKKNSLGPQNPGWSWLRRPENLLTIRLGLTAPSFVIGPNFSVPSTR